MVEEQLLVQIGSKFNSFFNLQQDFEGLELELKEAVECLGVMRSDLKTVIEPVQKGLLVSELMQKRREMQILYEKLELVSDLRQSQSTIRSLVAANDFSGATKLAAESTQVLGKELVGCRALQHMLHKVNKMSHVVQNKMQADFQETASQFNHEESTRDTLLSLILGLQHSDQLVSALGRYRTSLLAETKKSVEECLSEDFQAHNKVKPEIDAPRGGGRDILMEILCEHENAAYVSLLKEMTSKQLRLTRRAVDFHHFLLESLEKGMEKPDEAAMALIGAESCSVLYDVCDESHKKCARVLMARAKRIPQLGLADFHEIFEMMLGFCVDGEKLLEAAWEKTKTTDKSNLTKSVSLRSTLLQQAKSFIEAFHTTKIAKLSALLEQETWSQAEVPAQYQRLVDGFAQRSSNPLGADVDAGEPGGSQKMLLVMGQHYRVPMSLLQLLRELKEYMDCADALPALCTDILQRIVDILAHYNQRTCQLVLGAGAMHLAGLKSITARHLVLTSQCLSVMLVNIPLIRHYLAGYLPTRHEVLLVRFDAIAKDFLEHRSQIHSKIVSIFRERIDFHCKVVISQPQPRTDEPPRAWSKNLLKESTTLYRVLIQYLPEDQLSPIFAQISQLVNQHLVTHISSLDLSSASARALVLRDLQHLLDGVSAEGDRQAIVGLRGLQHFKSSFGGLEDFMLQRLENEGN